MLVSSINRRRFVTLMAGAPALLTATQKPYPGMTLNRNNPLAQDLASAFLFNNSLVDVCGSSYVGYSAVPIQAAGPDGYAVQPISAGDPGYLNPRGIFYSVPSDKKPSIYSAPITIMARVMTSDLGGSLNEQRIINYGNLNNKVMGFGFAANGFSSNGQCLFFSPLGDHVGSCQSTVFTDFAANVWTTVGVSQSAASARKFFKDGVFESNSFNTSIGASSIDPSATVYVGGGNWNGGDGGCWWVGLISYVMVWLRALTNDEMTSVMNNPFQMFGGGPGLLKVNASVG